jgi:hypothetical protein
MVRMYRSGDMTSIGTQFKLWLYHNSVCVSSTDPRLREFDKQTSHDAVTCRWLRKRGCVISAPLYPRLRALALPSKSSYAWVSESIQ